MSTFSFISQCRPEYSENLFNANSVITDQSQVNKISGSALSSISIDSENFYEKYKSLKLFNNSITTPLVVNVWNAFGFVTNNDGNHILSLRVLHKQVTPFEHKLKVNVFANSIFSHSIELSITETNRNEWLTFAQSFNVSSEVEIGLTFEFTLDPTDPTEQCELWVGGLKIEYDDRNLGTPSVYTLPRDFNVGLNDIFISETQWDVSDIGTNNINDGDSLNLFTLINNATHKNTTNSDTYDELNIVSNAIRTTYRNGKIIHNIRLALNISAGSDQHYQMQIRRVIDNSIVYRALMQRNPDEATQTIEMTTRTLSESDPFVIDGFYIAFVNNSGAIATINGALSLVIISSYQKAQNGFT